MQLILTGQLIVIGQILPSVMSHDPQHPATLNTLGSK
ncbi:hypothetical protein LVISKB_1883 [Levilactobacillus brevis KB290]|uniref:Uncharacterized protein n=1 Tax=Levilactobacillus brevis KB290 TaxID=1001583 RepID=M5AFA6_LEVBR|nr:hypothetical protein LVISKB_1883 [Levilactobacillus brevis KB290]